MQEHYDNFFEDVFVECEDKYGPVEEMNVCDNLGDHLVGNVYVKFKKEEVITSVVEGKSNDRRESNSGDIGYLSYGTV